MNKEGTWSLKEIYPGFDDPSYAKDFAALQTLCKEFAAFAEKAEQLPHAELLTGYLTYREQIEELSQPLMLYSMLRRNANTKDTEAASWGGRVAQTLSTAAAPEARCKGLIAKMDDLDTLIDTLPLAGEYRYLLGNLVKDSQYLLGAGEEEVFSRMSISGADAWSELQTHLTATVRVQYNGGTCGLSTIRNLAYDPDQTVRREAYQAELAAYPQIADSVAYSLNSIKRQVLTECELRGFASPLEQTLHQARMKRETLDALLEAMEAYMPKFREYLRAKAAYLGHEGGLPWYDLFAPVGRDESSYTIEQARDILLSLFSTFDDSLCDMVRTAFDEDWIDFYPREGKVGGAFCVPVIRLKQSRVMTNFDGSFSDVVTLAHELGHAYHSLQIFSHRPLNRRYSMPLAETASNFNETLVMNAAIAAASDPQQKLKLLESRISDVAQIIVDIASRYLFEKSVFDNRSERFLPADELCRLMLDAQDKTYGDGLDAAQRHPYMWICKSHYYRGSLSYYNFPYAFGGLFASGLYARYREQGKAFVPLYLELLHGSTVCTAEDTAKIAGIDLTQRAFWEQGLAAVAEEIDEFVQLSKTLK